MKKLIGFPFGVLLLISSSSFSQTPAEGAMLFSRGCPTYNFPIVFVYQAGKMRTSDFQQSIKTVTSWGKLDESHFFVKTGIDSFNCAILSTNYSTMWVNKKDPRSYFNGVYYNAKRDSLFLMDYPTRNAIDFFKSDLSGGFTASPLIYSDSDQINPHPHITFGKKILCYNRLTGDPFSNVFEMLDSANQPISGDNQWECADKRIVPDSVDQLNSGVNFVDYDGTKGFLVQVTLYPNYYEFVTVDCKRFTVPYLAQDSGNQYRDAVMASWNWQKGDAKPVSPFYLVNYAIHGNVFMSYRTQKFLLKNQGFPGKKWVVQWLGQLLDISDSFAVVEYGANWRDKLIEIPDAFLATYTILGTSAVSRPGIKVPAALKFFGPSVIFDIRGRRITSHGAYGLNLVREPNGTVLRNMNLNRRDR